MERHLLPDEIDLLLDGEVGFGTAPLKSHVRKCEQCRAELQEARALVTALEHLPHLTPSPAFAQHVLVRVQIFVPWHVALLDWVRGWIPRSRPAMAAATVALAAVAAALLVAALWAVARLDAVLFAFSMGVARVREVIVSALGEVLGELFGEPALAVLRESGMAGVTMALLLILVMTAVAAGALRLLAAGAGRR